MKKFTLFVTILLVASMIFGILGCKEPAVDDGSQGNTPIVDTNPDSSDDTTTDTVAPKDVSNLVAINKDASILLTWTDSTDNDILGYEVSWDKSTPINRAVSLSENSMIVAPKAQGCYISNLTNGTTYSFTVKSIDTSGNKSAGQSVSITPAVIEKSPLVIELVPSTIEKTKDSVEISVNVTTDFSSNIKKIAYKEGTFTKIDEVLAGTDITTTQKITATKNTTYTVVATDTAGRREIQWITVDNIDVVSPAQVSDLKAVYNKDSKTISVSWKNPTDEDFAGTILTYKKIGSDATKLEFNKNTTSCTLKNILPDNSTYQIEICSIDEYGNSSVAKTTSVVTYSILKLTINAGKGWLETETENKVKSITVEFEAGESFYQIYERFDWDTCGERDDEKDIYYCYKENGNFYDWIYEVIDKEGKILLEGEWEHMPLYEDTTFYLHYRKLVPITFDFNGGIGKDSVVTDYFVEYGYEGLEFYSYDYEIQREGYFLRGWTKTRDGEDFVTICPSEPTTLYAKWEEPKTCTLILKSGEYSKFYDYSNGTQLSSTMSLTFESGKSLERVLEENGYYSNAIVDESEFLGKRFGGFKDSQGNVYDMGTILTESVEIEAFTRDLYPYEVGINMNFNGINIEGYDEYCVYVETYEYKEYLEMMSENLQDEVEDYLFVGWSFTKDGDDFVDSLKGGTTTTIYAKWMSYEDMAKILPYYYNEDKTQVTFIFRPADFGLNWKASDNYTVKLLCDITKYDTGNNNENFVLSKNSDGNYTVTFNYNDIADGFFYWQGFQFCVEDKWYGLPEYIYSIPEETTMKGEGDNGSFKLQLFPMSLGIDLNGGNIYGDTTSKFFGISWTQYDEHHLKFRSIEDTLQYYLGVDNPTREGYVFAGWTFTKDGNDLVNNKYDHLPYGKYTLYARWIEEKDCTLTLQAVENSEFFDYDGNSLGTSLKYDFIAGRRLGEVFSWNEVSPEYTSSNDRTYEFFHYVDDYGNEYFQDTILADTVTLYPVFKLVPRITLDFNGGYAEGYDGEVFVYDDFEIVGEGLLKDSYDFAGWTLTKDGKDFITYTEEDVTVYARWVRFTPESSTGVYSYTVPIDEISEQWEGNYLKADFAVMVMYDKQVRELYHKDEYRYNYDVDKNLYGKNLTISTTRQGNFNIVDGIAATVTETDLTVFVDMNKFYCESDIASTDGDILVRKPYVVALASKAHAPEDYSFTDWGDTMIMNPNAFFPIDLQEQGTPADMFTLCYVAGTMTDPAWEPSSIELDENNSFALESDGEEIQFKFTDGSWNCSYGILDGPINYEGEYTLGGSGNIFVNLPKGTYRFTLDVTEEYAKVIVTKE